MKKIVFLYLFFFSITQTIGCITTHKRPKPVKYEYKKYFIDPQFFSNPPRSVAILPFSNITKDSKITIENWKTMVEEKYFDLEEEQKRTEEYLKRIFVRRAFYKHFSVKPFRDKEIIEIDQKLKEKGIEWAEDLEKMSPHEIAKLLDVDALIYGEITKLNRIYLGLYSEVTVGCKLKMFDTRTDKVLWLVNDVEKSRAGGASLSLTGVVTGILDASLNMRKIWVFRVADDLFRRVVGYLPDLDVAIEPIVMVSREGAKLFERPGFLNTSIGSRSIKKLETTTKLTILEKTDNWYRVRTDEGDLGWIKPDSTVLAGKELGRPFDVVSDTLNKRGMPTNKELGGLFDLQGTAFFKQKKFDEAANAFNKAIKYNPKNAAAHFHYAWAIKISSKLSEKEISEIVIKHLTEASNIAPDNINYSYNLGLAYSDANRIQDAINEWKKCLKLAPNLENVKSLIKIAEEQLSSSEKNSINFDTNSSNSE